MSRMKILTLAAAMAALVLLAGAAPAPPEGVAYPNTEPGRHAREYFVAFNAGEAAMRAFWTAHGSPAALAQRPVEARLDVWRQMHVEFGALTPLRVTETDDAYVTILARTRNAGNINIQFRCEEAAPHGLVALQVTDADAGPGAPPNEPPADTGPPPTDADIVAKLGADLDSLAKAGAFSGAAILDKDGKTLFSKAYGLADREKNVPNRADTRFNLGSINKIFTNVAILQLAQQGKLSLDDTIDRFLTDYPKENAGRITIQMLLDHRSGVPDVLRNEAVWKDPAAIRTLDQWYALVRDMPLDFEPGTKNQYSNGGFVVLGAVIAKASGEDYYDYIRKHVYTPAGMTRSDHYASDEKVEGMAKSYTRRSDGSGPRPAAEGSAGTSGPSEALRLGRGSPAGGGYSTTGDLVRFARALRAGKLMDLSHGAGMLSGTPQFAIAGGSPGVNGMLQLQGPYTFVVLANMDPPAAERLSGTTGRMLRRASPPAGAKRDVRPVGGP